MVNSELRVRTSGACLRPFYGLTEPCRPSRSICAPVTHRITTLSALGTSQALLSPGSTQSMMTSKNSAVLPSLNIPLPPHPLPFRPSLCWALCSADTWGSIFWQGHFTGAPGKAQPPVGLFLQMDHHHTSRGKCRLPQICGQDEKSPLALAE